MDCKLVQPWNVKFPIVARAVAPVRSADVKFEQLSNAPDPIVSTLAGIVMDAKLVQPKNVDDAIVARAVAPVSSTDVKLVAFEKFVISVTLDATTTLSI
jgi:hypothetical protein